MSNANHEPHDMDRHACAFCTDPAIGIDEDGELTCGAESCSPVERLLPAGGIIEASGEDDEDTDEDAPRGSADEEMCE